MASTLIRTPVVARDLPGVEAILTSRLRRHESDLELAVELIDTRDEHFVRAAVSRVTSAALYAAVGERERALRLLERACDARDPDVGFIRSIPAFDSLRREPGFAALLRRTGLG